MKRAVVLDSSQEIRMVLDNTEPDDVSNSPTRNSEIVVVDTTPDRVSPNLNQSTISTHGTLRRQAPGSSQQSQAVLWKRKPQGRKSTSRVWDYFTYDKASDTSSCIILECGAQLKGKNASNLKSHLKSSHKLEHGIVIENDTGLLKSPLIPTIKSQRQLTADGKLVDYKYDAGNPKQIRFTNQLSMLFGSSAIPNHLVANEDLIKCFEIADPKLLLPGRRALETNIDQLMVSAQHNIRERLKKASRICLSSDIWTKKGMSSSYLGVLATYYDSSEEAKVNTVLAVKQFRSVRHTASNIAMEMDLILSTYEVPAHKIWKIITDSGSNMVCAFRDFNIDNIDQDDDNTTGEEHLEYSMEELESETIKYSRLSSFIHTLLLCLKKVDAKKSFEKLITNIQTLISKFTSSQVLTGDLLESSGLKLVAFSSTRWNVTFLVLTRLLLVQNSIQLLLTKYGKQKYNLSQAEWKLAENLKSFLAPFNTYTDMSSSEGSTALSEVIVMLKQLRKHLDSYSSVRGFIGISKEIQDELSRRFRHFFSERAAIEFEGIYIASTLLDPRYRIILDTAEVELARKHLLSSYSLHSGHSASAAVSGFLIDAGRKRKFDILEKFQSSSGFAPTGMSQELDAYVLNKTFDTENDSYNPWSFWNQQKAAFPNLSAIALQILSVPISIGHVERVFSFAGHATCGRNRLEGDHLECEVFLHQNRHLIHYGNSD